MTNKKKKQPTQEEALQKLLERVWCYYCERDFDDQSILVAHQRAKHYKCNTCGRRLETASGLHTHCSQVHKENLEKVDNAMPGREGFEVTVYGMIGMPEVLLEHHRQTLTTEFFKREAERRAETGNPPPGTQNAENADKKRQREEPIDETKARLAEFRAAKKRAKEAGVPFVPPTKQGAKQESSTQEEPEAMSMPGPTEILGLNVQVRPSGGWPANYDPLSDPAFLANPQAQTAAATAPPPTSKHIALPATSYEVVRGQNQCLPPPQRPSPGFGTPAVGVKPYTPNYPQTQQLPGGSNGYGFGHQATSYGMSGSPPPAPYNRPPPMPGYLPHHAQPPDIPLQPRQPLMSGSEEYGQPSPPSALDLRRLGQPSPPGLPQRPSFGMPNISKEDMQQMHSGFVMPTQASPAVDTRSQPFQDSLNELVATQGATISRPPKPKLRDNTKLVWGENHMQPEELRVMRRF